MLNNMKSRGYTIVELIIVIAIIGILVGLGTVGMLNSRASSRDSERKADLDAIAIHLESFYNMHLETVSDYYGSGYPSTSLCDNPRSFLIDIDPKSLDSPSDNETTNSNLYCATTADPLDASATDIDIDKYTYQPLYYDYTGASWALCEDASQECRKFILYAKLEDGTIYQVESKNQ